MMWVTYGPRVTMYQLGYLPEFLDENDPRSAREQLNANYIGGWNPLSGFKFDPKTKALLYPEDPPIHPIASTDLRSEKIFVYPGDWVLILQHDGTFEAARLN